MPEASLTVSTITSSAATVLPEASLTSSTATSSVTVSPAVALSAVAGAAGVLAGSSVKGTKISTLACLRKVSTIV